MENFKLFKNYLDNIPVDYEQLSDNALIMQQNLDITGNIIVFIGFANETTVEVMFNLTKVPNNLSTDILEFCNRCITQVITLRLCTDNNQLQLSGSTKVPIGDEDMLITLIMRLSDILFHRADEIYPEIMKILYK